MSLFNFWCIAYSSYYICSLFFHHSFCVLGGLISNIISQIFYIHFDLFLLFKTCGTSGYNRYILLGTFAILLNRFVWAFLDIIQSHSYVESDMCLYYQNPITGLGYNSADMICDAFCTIVSIVFNWKSLYGASFFSMSRVLVQENILRSIIILAVNFFMLYMSASVTDPFLVLCSYFIQNYAYSVCINMELLWIDERQKKSRASAVSMSAAGLTFSKQDSSQYNSKTRQSGIS
ncbi:hypothetical protein BDR26DRAFT_872333, partial [Obelidium mucronatum]